MGKTRNSITSIFESSCSDVNLDFWDSDKIPEITQEDINAIELWRREQDYIEAQKREKDYVDEYNKSFFGWIMSLFVGKRKVLKVSLEGRHYFDSR